MTRWGFRVCRQAQFQGSTVLLVNLSSDRKNLTSQLLQAVATPAATSSARPYSACEQGSATGHMEPSYLLWRLPSSCCPSQVCVWLLGLCLLVFLRHKNLASERSWNATLRPPNTSCGHIVCLLRSLTHSLSFHPCHHPVCLTRPAVVQYLPNFFFGALLTVFGIEIAGDWLVRSYEKVRVWAKGLCV